MIEIVIFRPFLRFILLKSKPITIALYYIYAPFSTISIKEAKNPQYETFNDSHLENH